MIKIKALTNERLANIREIIPKLFKWLQSKMFNRAQNVSCKKHSIKTLNIALYSYSSFHFLK